MGLRTILHFLAAIHFWFGCYYDWHYVKIPSNVHKIGSSFGKSGKLRFLTYWDALLQAVFFTLCLLNDLIGTNDHEPIRVPFIRKVKDLLYSSLAFPLSMFVGISFWSIYLVDRELIFPRILDAYFPQWLNHIMHTNIMIFILIELYSSYRKYPSRKFGLTVLAIFMVTYLIWIHIIYINSGVWVYPILEVLNQPLRIVFFAFALGLVVGLYLLGEKLNKFVWQGYTTKLSKKLKH